METRHWKKTDLALAGAAVVQALEGLESGACREMDIDLGTGKIRVVNDLANGRVVVFQLSNLEEQRRWRWEDGVPTQGSTEMSLR